MSAIRKSLFAFVVLGMAVANAAPAAAQRGIPVRIDMTSTWTLTVMNLTDGPLTLTNSVTATKAQRPPFNGVPACTADASTLCVPIGAYQNITWKSNTATIAYPNPNWNGTLSVLPQGMDPKWTVTLNFKGYNGTSNGLTSVYLTADVNGNPDWVDNTGYNISCSYPDWYNSRYNVMTLSGTDLVATLYAPYVDTALTPPVGATLVIRQRWPHTGFANGYDDSISMPCLRYQDIFLSH